MTHICVGKLTNIGSDNGLSPGRRQAIIWTNTGILLIGTLGTNFSEFLIVIHTFSFNKMPLKMSFAKWRPFCLGLNVLRTPLDNVLALVHIIPRRRLGDKPLYEAMKAWCIQESHGFKFIHEKIKAVVEKITSSTLNYTWMLMQRMWVSVSVIVHFPVGEALIPNEITSWTMGTTSSTRLYAMQYEFLRSLLNTFVSFQFSTWMVAIMK